MPISPISWEKKRGRALLPRRASWAWREWSLRPCGKLSCGPVSQLRKGGTPQHAHKGGFLELGLSGRENSAGKRTALLKRLELPEHLSPNGLLQALSVLYTREELFQLCEELEDDKES
ncbi:MAG: DUF4093 domain-containing protein [Eubacteriales bacterium]